MKRFNWILLTIWMCSAGIAQAMDGVFDRSAEVNKYLELLNSEYPATVIQTSKDICNSGISDPALVAALNDKLQRRYQTVTNKRDDISYVAWLVKALGSTGAEDARATFDRIAKESKISKLRDVSESEAKLLAWNRGKNEAMASRRDDVQGANPRVAMLLNLLKTDDYSYRRFAVYRANMEKILDPRIMDEIDAQLNQYMNAGRRDNDTENDTIKHYLRFLGYSPKPQHRATIERIAASKADRDLALYAKKVLRNHEIS